MSAALGNLSPMRSMQLAQAKQPMSTWPSPPRFQNFMRKAGASARETHSSMARSCSMTQTRRVLPKAPPIMVV